MPNLTYFNRGNPNKAEPADTARDQAASCYAGSDNAEPRNVEFGDFEYKRNKSDNNEFHDTEEFDKTCQELGSTLSAVVSDDDHSKQGDLEDRVMFKRWFNEPIKDGPYIAK